MKFVDEVRIFARSGNGGKGAVSFLREKYKPNGGPNGGDGGRGGDVVFVADPNYSTLLDFRYKPRQIAESGEQGRGKNQHGKDAEDLVIRVPVGTVVYDDETGEQLHDLTEPGERWVALPGGKGGLGNQHFATPARQAPRYAQPGIPGQERNLRLELKLLADVGLVGYPNAGKSTLLSRVSAARPKIADYPFTTLTPNLGVVKAGETANGVPRTFVIADIPGLIEGASEGIGLGTRFLRHVERTALFLHVIDFADPEEGGPWGRFEKVQHEIASYDATLAAVPALVAANKMDIPEARENLVALREKFEAKGLTVFPISGVTGEGIDALVWAVASRVDEARARRRAEELEARRADEPVSPPEDSEERP